MSKASEFANITRRNIRGDKEIGEDGYNMFSTIAAPYSTAFAEKLEEASDVDGKEARRRYIRAFLYGLKKVLPEEQFMKIRNGMKSDHDISCITLGTASQLLKQKQKFEKLKELFPWDGAGTYERRFFDQIQRLDEKRGKINNRRKKWYIEHREHRRKKQFEYQQRYLENGGREKHNEYNRRYKELHKEELRIKNREYKVRKRMENIEQYRAQCRIRYEKNREKIRAQSRDRYAARKEETNAKKREKRAREKAERQAAALAAVSEGMTLQNAVQPISYT